MKQKKNNYWKKIIREREDNPQKTWGGGRASAHARAGCACARAWPWQGWIWRVRRTARQRRLHDTHARARTRTHTPVAEWFCNVCRRRRASSRRFIKINNLAFDRPRVLYPVRSDDGRLRTCGVSFAVAVAVASVCTSAD